MSKIRLFPHLVSVMVLASGLWLTGCQYMPWVSDDKEEDLAFEDDALFAEKEGGKTTKEDDFFAEEGEKIPGEQEQGFASTDQETDTSEMKTNVETLQQQQEALTSKIRQLEEVIASLGPRIDATQQRLEGSLGAMSEKSDVLEPEVQELKVKIAKLNEEIEHLKAARVVPPPQKTRRPKKTSSRRRTPIPAKYAAARDAYLGGDYDKSLLLFQDYAATNPPVYLQDNVHYWVGANYYKLEMYDDAIKQFETVLTKYSKGNKVHDARYMLGVCYLSKGEKSRALDIMQAEMNSNPPREVRKKIQEKLAEIE